MNTQRPMLRRQCQPSRGHQLEPRGRGKRQTLEKRRTWWEQGRRKLSTPQGQGVKPSPQNEGQTEMLRDCHSRSPRNAEGKGPCQAGGRPGAWNPGRTGDRAPEMAGAQEAVKSVSVFMIYSED